MDFILNGQGHGNVASTLMASGFNMNAFRPYIGNDGKSYVTSEVNPTSGEREFDKDGKLILHAAPTQNAVATLRYEDWRLIDAAVLRVARQRLRLLADLRAGGLQFTIAEGLGVQVFSTERMTDPGAATISMDGLRKGTNDRPEFEMINLPLPIVHSDFFMSVRQIMASRRGNTPIDTAMSESATRRVAESLEQLHLGNLSTYTYGGGSVYGLLNFPQRITATLTAPTATAWVPSTTVSQVLAMKQKSIDAKNYGPWILYVSTNWDQYMDRDYNVSGGNNPNQTLRERLSKIEGISAIRTLDYMSGYQMLLVQQSTDTVRTVMALDFTTVQWPSEGGFQQNFKVLAVMVPQIRADSNGNCGLVHGS